MIFLDRWSAPPYPAGERKALIAKSALLGKYATPIARRSRRRFAIP
jgi:hypothetical protein